MWSSRKGCLGGERGYLASWLFHFFFSFYGHTHSIWKFLSQKLNLSCTCGARWGSNLHLSNLSHSSQILNLLHHSRNSRAFPSWRLNPSILQVHWSESFPSCSFSPKNVLMPRSRLFFRGEDLSWRDELTSWAECRSAEAQIVCCLPPWAMDPTKEASSFLLGESNGYM